MEHFYIITNQEKDDKLEVTNLVKNMLEENGKRVSMYVRQCILDGVSYTDAQTIPEDVDCILVLGGDGTLLQAARDVVEKEIPLLGINLGTLGYLAEVEKTGIEKAINQLIRGEYHLEDRMMLTG